MYNCSDNRTNIFINFCVRLPYDIVRKIYEEYAEPQMLYDELNLKLNLYSSTILNSYELKIFLPNILKNKILVNYLFKNNQIFKIIYTKHFIKKENDFLLIKCPVESMALAWLMHLYH